MNRFIYNFIQNKTDINKRNTIIGDTMNGSIGIGNIDSELKAIKARWTASVLATNHVVEKDIKALNIIIIYFMSTGNHGILNKLS